MFSLFFVACKSTRIIRENTWEFLKQNNESVHYYDFDEKLTNAIPVGTIEFVSTWLKIFKGIEIVQESNQEVFLDIMLHLGTLIAVLITEWRFKLR